jgi:hypothetical protein
MIYNPPSSHAAIPHPAENTQFPVMAADAVLSTEHAYQDLRLSSILFLHSYG